MEYDRKCTTREKIVFFVLNFKLFIESCVVLGFGIVGLTLKDVVLIVIDVDLYVALVSIFIIVGCLGILSCFIGYCGAMAGNRFVILVYIISLSLTLVLLFTSAIFGFVFGHKLQRDTTDTMMYSLNEYDPNVGSNSTINKGWDYMQRTLQCCGVVMYVDWEEYNDSFRGRKKIPDSCCVPDYYPVNNQNCTTATNEKSFYSSAMAGCGSKVLMLFEKYSPIVVGIGAVDALLLIMGITCGGIAFTFL